MQLALAQAWEAPWVVGAALRVSGLVDGGEPGLERLREAVAVLEGAGAPLEHAHALTDLGAALRRAGRRTGAGEPLRRGMDLAYRCGATALAERARAELVVLGARPRRLAISGIDALTASERRVAQLAAEGRSNRDIAQALFVTTRTVEVHLTSAYRKLGIRTRAELPQALAPAARPGKAHA